MKQDKICGKRILVVDDDPSARESMSLLLRIDRHAVTEAKDGMQALDLVSRQQFDIVTLDYVMPGMLGGEVALNIRRMVPDLPIVMVTAYVEKLSGSDKPVDAVLGKPYSMDQLRSAISQVIPPA